MKYTENLKYKKVKLKPYNTDFDKIGWLRRYFIFLKSSQSLDKKYFAYKCRRFI